MLGIKSIVRREGQLIIHWQDDSKMADWDMGCCSRRFMEENEVHGHKTCVIIHQFEWIKGIYFNDYRSGDEGVVKEI